VAVAWLTHDPVRWREFKSALPYLVTFMQEYRPTSTGLMLGHAWSLGIEEKFYLVWPLLIVGLFPFRLRTMGLLLALGFGICLLPALFARSYGGLLLGALLAISLTKPSSSRLFGGEYRGSVGLALGVIAASYTGMVGYGVPVLFFSAGVTLLVGALVLRRSWLRTFLERPWMVTFGKRSYSMYLIHVLVINSVERVPVKEAGTHWYVVIPAAYLLSFGGATVIYYAVERPCVRYGRKLAAAMRESLTKRSPINTTLGDVQAIRDPL